MRRKRKVSYWVQDWFNTEGRDSFWWQSGKWTDKYDPKVRSTNVKTCKTFDQAMKVARSLKAKGGGPLISQFTIKKGRRFIRDYNFENE